MASESAVAVRSSRRPVSRARIEVVASRSVAVFGLLFGAQTFPVMMGQDQALQPSWFWMLAGAVYGSLLVSTLASIVKRGVRLANILVCGVWLAAMLLWPLAVVDAGAVASERPWLWFLCTVATAAAAIAFSVRWATAYLLVAPLAYAVIRMLPSGGAASLDLAVIDAVYAILLGGAVLVIITLLRQAASAVDQAQSTALARYVRAVRQHAVDAERLHVDALVHDSVLTTLLEAARASTPETQAQVSAMAGRAMGHLRDALESTDGVASTVTVADLLDELEATAQETSSGFEVRHAEVPAAARDVLVPEPVADALASAMVQAMVNSVQHAGETSRWVSLAASEDQVFVEVGDAGVGFRVEEVPEERLGVRVSIVERVENAGGAVRLVASPGRGTVVSLEWPGLA